MNEGSPINSNSWSTWEPTRSSNQWLVKRCLILFRGYVLLSLLSAVTCNFAKNTSIHHCNSVSHRKAFRISKEENTKAQILLVPVVRDSHRHRVSLGDLTVLRDPALLDSQGGLVFLAVLFRQLVQRVLLGLGVQVIPDSQVHRIFLEVQLDQVLQDNQEYQGGLLTHLYLVCQVHLWDCKVPSRIRALNFSHSTPRLYRFYYPCSQEVQ